MKMMEIPQQVLLASRGSRMPILATYLTLARPLGIVCDARYTDAVRLKDLVCQARHLHAGMPPQWAACTNGARRGLWGVPVPDTGEVALPFSPLGPDRMVG